MISISAIISAITVGAKKAMPVIYNAILGSIIMDAVTGVASSIANLFRPATAEVGEFTRAIENSQRAFADTTREIDNTALRVVAV